MIVKPLDLPKINNQTSNYSSKSNTDRNRKRSITGKTNRSNSSLNLSETMPIIQSNSSIEQLHQKSNKSSKYSSRCSSRCSTSRSIPHTKSCYSKSTVSSLSKRSSNSRPSTISNLEDIDRNSVTSPISSKHSVSSSRPLTGISHQSYTSPLSKRSSLSNKSISTHKSILSDNDIPPPRPSSYDSAIYDMPTIPECDESRPITPEWFKITKTQIQPIKGGKGYFSTSLTKTLESKDMPDAFQLEGVKHPIITHRPAFDYITHTPVRIIPVKQYGETCVDAPSFMHRTVLIFIIL